MLLDDVDRINTDVDPLDAEAAYEDALGRAQDSLTAARLAGPQATAATNSLAGFAQSQLLKVRASARTRSVQIAQGRTLAAVDSAIQELARADTPLARAQATDALDATFERAAADGTFTPDVVERMRQNARTNSQDARAAWLIQQGRPEEVLSGLREGTLEITDPERALRWQTAAAQAIEQRGRAATLAANEQDEIFANELVDLAAQAQLIGGAEGMAILPSRQRVLQVKDFNTRIRLLKIINNPDTEFGPINGVSNPSAVRMLNTRAAERTLTRADVRVAWNNALITNKQYNQFIREAATIERAGGAATREDIEVSTGYNHIEIAYGIIGDQPAADILTPEQITNLNRDYDTYRAIVNADAQAGRDVSKFERADEIARRVLQGRKNTFTTNSTELQLVRLFLPDPSEWTLASLNVATAKIMRAFEQGLLTQTEVDTLIAYQNDAQDINEVETLLGIR